MIVLGQARFDTPFILWGMGGLPSEVVIAEDFMPLPLKPVEIEFIDIGDEIKFEEGEETKENE